MKIVLNDDGRISTLAQGSEEDLLKYWDQSKRDLCSWMLEGDFPTAEEQKEATEDWEDQMNFAPQNVDDLKRLFKELDHSWWTLAVEDAKE